MDMLPIETSDLLANTCSQPLSKHLFAVGYIAYKLLEFMHINNSNLKQSALIAGILHDLGKVDPNFQNWVTKKIGKLPEDSIPEDGVHIDAPKKFSFENHPRHHELSWILAEALLDNGCLNPEQRDQVAHAIYWHHAKPVRKHDKFNNSEAIYAIFKKSLASEKFQEVYQTAIAVINDIISLAAKFKVIDLLPKIDSNKSFVLKVEVCPAYKKYDTWADKMSEFQDNVRKNALNNLIRAAVISADRLVSSCSSEDLEEYLSEGSLGDLLDRAIKQEESDTLKNAIEQCLQGFNSAYPNSARNQAQTKAANSLAKLHEFAAINQTASIGVLQGPAGCGKTKIALEWALKTNAKKIIWICPRVQICLGLLHDLTAEEYLPNCQIEIFTGEYKKIVSHGIDFIQADDTDESDYFSAEIVITTIDQIVNSIRSHSHVNTFIQFMNAHVVFDEFHELVNMRAFNLLFAELIEAKKEQGSYANMLLVSATPHYFYLKEFLNINQNDIVAIDSFNQSSYQIEFLTYDEKEENSPLIKAPQKGSTFVISNTALDAQLGYLCHYGQENSVLLHSKYTKQDKRCWFDAVFESFKQDGSRQYDVLRSGPIIQASLNLTCNRMLTEITSAENWLQRLGRLDRFGENTEVNRYITVIPQSLDVSGKLTSHCAKFLNHLCVYHSTKSWLQFLKAQLNGQEKVNINQLYQIYRDFYVDKQSQEFVRRDFNKALKKSVELINEKIIDPISVIPRSKLTKDSIKIASNSLRGDDRFVQMAVCEVSKDYQITFSEKYAYDDSSSINPADSVLTQSIESMRGYGNDDANLVQFMQKKHHNIKQDERYKKARNEWELIKAARSPEYPIYLSYTPQDLDAIGGMREANNQAIYYVTSNKQPVGSMVIDKLEQYLKKLKCQNNST